MNRLISVLLIKSFVRASVVGFLILMSLVAGAQEKAFTNLIGMEFVRIDTGRMRVGAFMPPYPVLPNGSGGNKQGLVMKMNEERAYDPEDYRLARELATRDAAGGFVAVISRPYYMGKFEVTQAQWEKVMGSNPSAFTSAWVANPDNHPVETVTWKDVQRFLKSLNLLDSQHHYRLPTEFEWEYAARAGAEGDIPWSDIREQAQLGLNTTAEVGKKMSNQWGIYDMLGNVWEWVADYYNEKLFADPTPPKNGKDHVLKGASFTGDVKNATYMTHAAGPGNGWDVGFRVVMEHKEP